MSRFYMKKIFVVAIVAFFALTLSGKDRKGISVSELNAVISEYKDCDGFEVIRFSRLGTALLKTIAKVTGDDIEFPNGVNKFLVVEYEDCAASIRNDISRRIEDILKGQETILEVKDGGETVRAYGVVNKDSDKLKNFIFYTPSDNTLVCVFGSIDVNAIYSIID